MTDSPSSTQLLDDNDQLNNKEYEIDVETTIPNIAYDSNISESGQHLNRNVTGALLLAVFVANTGTSFHFGYASGVMNAPQDVIEAFINETSHRRNNQTNISESTITLILSLAVSIFALGGMIGGLFGGFITDRFGRKGGMYLNNIVSSLSCILMFISKPVHSYELLIIGRFFLGLSCGYGSSVAPTYINEISPSNLRGTLGAFFQLGVVFILFISQIISLNSVLGAENTWHYALSLPIVFSVMQIILLFFIPESPKFLLLKRNNSVGAEKG